MKKLIFLLLLVSNVVAQVCVGMKYPGGKKDESIEYSLIDFFKRFEGFEDWFSQHSEHHRNCLYIYYNFKVSCERFVPALSLYEVFFAHVFYPKDSLVEVPRIASEGSFDDLDICLVEQRDNQLQFQEHFRKLQVVLVIDFIKRYVSQNPHITLWQQLCQIMGGLVRRYCQEDKLFNVSNTGKKSRRLNYLLFRRPEQVREKLKLYQASKNMSDEQVDEIIKKRKLEKK